MAPRPGLKIGRILGIPIYVHPSWVIIFSLITFSLAIQFAQKHPQWNTAQHWAVGLLTSLLFFGSVVFHELSHSAVAQHYKIRVLSITLFVFGGVARIGRDPSKAIQEFNIAIAGPLASGFLAVAFFGLTLFFPDNPMVGPYKQMVGALAGWLAYINLMVAVFNLIPGFPLDGGRIFRAIVWGATKSYLRATRIAGASGKLFAYAMILFGAWAAFQPEFAITIGSRTIFYGGFASGIWLAFIGWFLLNAAQESVAQVAIRETLAGLSAADVMSQEVPTVGGHITLEEYGAEVLRTGRRCHLVLSDDRLVGMMNVHTLNAVPRPEWAHNSVQAAMIPREKVLWTSPDEPLLRLLERLLSADVNQMPVVSGAGDGAPQVVGMVTRDSILRVVQTRSELGPLAAGR
jgi:Zn-dependent protease